VPCSAPPDCHVLLKAHVASVCFKCFRCYKCFRWMLYMLQWLYTYVAKVCYQYFICVFQTHVASVFIWMLHMFHTYISCVLSRWLQWFSSIFRCFFQVYQKHVLSVSSTFRRMLQLLYLDVSKVDRVLHLSSSPSATSSRCILLSTSVGHLYDATVGSFQIEGTASFPSCRLGSAGPRGARETECSAWASVRTSGC
jgi:hypothetical protein